MNTFLHHVGLAAPLFALVLVGYALRRFGRLPSAMSEHLSRFVFSIALPAMLFRLMCGLAALPAVDPKLLIAFFGGCLIVFIAGRWVGRACFGLDGVAQSIFALGGVFSNNSMLGLPLAKAALGDASIPVVALVLVFNSLTLWTMVTVSIEWSRHGTLSARGFARTAFGVATNPIVIGILGGTAVGLSGWPLPRFVDAPLHLLAQAAIPMALIALGMGLVDYGVREGWRISLSICALKLVLQPLVVWVLARLLGLPLLETQAVVLLASICVGANVYIAARQFQRLEGPVASSLVLSTGLSALTTPLALTLLGAV